MEIDHEVAGACQDRLTLAINMAFPDNPNVDQLAGAICLFLDHAISVACEICQAKIDDDDGKDIRKKAYRFILSEIDRHAANSD